MSNTAEQLNPYMQDIMAMTQRHIKTTESFFNECAADLDKLADTCSSALEKGNKLIFCGNGGSSCDAMHIAGEFVGRFIKDRKSLPALTLTADSCAITAIGNDYGYDQIFARQLEGMGNEGDILIGITTSGNSQNVIEAFKMAEEKNIYTVALLGKDGGKMANMGHEQFVVKSPETARVQECHITFLHMLCWLIEKKMGLCENN